MIKSEALYDCLKILNNWRELSNTELVEIANSHYGFGQSLIKPFRLELRHNILSSKSLQEKKDVIKSYIYELHRGTNFEGEIKSVEDLGIAEFPDLWGETVEQVKVTSFKMNPESGNGFFYIILSLYRLLFNEIQDCCNVFDIPFLEICNELGLPLNIIDINRLTAKWIDKRLKASLHIQCHHSLLTVFLL